MDEEAWKAGQQLAHGPAAVHLSEGEAAAESIGDVRLPLCETFAVLILFQEEGVETVMVFIAPTIIRL